jgi:hypothetical protein
MTAQEAKISLIWSPWRLSTKKFPTQFLQKNRALTEAEILDPKTWHDVCKYLSTPIFLIGKKLPH